MEQQTFDLWNQDSLAQQASVLELSPNLSNSSSVSGSPVANEFEAYPMPAYQYTFPQATDEVFFNYALPLTPSDFGSEDGAPFCSPRSRTTSLSFQAHPEGRIHATSGRRRAQNRAAQRAFRERKEKHAKDLETQLTELTEKYKTLESSHTELAAAYEKLRRTIELLTKSAGDDDGPPSNASTLTKLLDILHGDIKIKAEG